MRNRNLNLILRSFKTFRSTFDGLLLLILCTKKPRKYLVCLSYFRIFFTFYLGLLQIANSIGEKIGSYFFK